MQGKGAKDRYTILSELYLRVLDKYWRAYKPEKWHFTGRGEPSPLTIRACQHAFSHAKEKAGQKLNMYPHLYCIAPGGLWRRPNDRKRRNREEPIPSAIYQNYLFKKILDIVSHCREKRV
jgi:hypothetical protein